MARQHNRAPRAGARQVSGGPPGGRSAGPARAQHGGDATPPLPARPLLPAAARDPWIEAIEVQDSAEPFHDWNERIAAECYAPNGAARLKSAEDRIVDIVNNYVHLSFNFGPTLLAWLERERPDIHARVVEADQRAPSAAATATRSRRATATPSCRSPLHATGSRRSDGASPTSAAASAACRRASGCRDRSRHADARGARGGGDPLPGAVAVPGAARACARRRVAGRDRRALRSDAAVPCARRRARARGVLLRRAHHARPRVRGLPRRQRPSSAASRAGSTRAAGTTTPHHRPRRRDPRTTRRAATRCSRRRSGCSRGATTSSS